MTALQTAKSECSNCDNAGNCAGIGIADDLSVYRFRQPGKCWLGPDERGEINSCRYFEECIVPLARKRAQAASTQEQQRAAASLSEGVREYEIAVMPVATVKYAKCKRCQRRVIAPKRLCERCASNNTRKSKRQWWTRTRKNVASAELITKDL